MFVPHAALSSCADLFGAQHPKCDHLCTGCRLTPCHRDGVKGGDEKLPDEQKSAHKVTDGRKSQHPPSRKLAPFKKHAPI